MAQELTDVDALMAMGYKRAQAVAMLKPCAPGSVVDRVGEAVRRLQPDFVEPTRIEPPKVEAAKVERPAGKIIRLDGIKVRDEPVVAVEPEPDGGPLEWLIQKLSWMWHTWNDPIIKAKVVERDRLLAPRQGLLQSMKRWAHLVERAEKSDPGQATTLLTEAQSLEPAIIQALSEVNPTAKITRRRKAR